MKIINVKTFIIGNPWKNWVLVKVETDEGIYGWGDATQGLATMPVVGAVQELRRFYQDKNPLAIERLWEEMHKGLYLTANGTLLSAMAAIETACWDILGKVLSVPIHQLLGGRVRDRIKAYANGWYRGPRDVKFFADRAAEVVGMGYRALKLDPFGANYRVLDDAERKLSLELVGAVRRTVGDNVDIIIEMHDRLSVVEAIQMNRRLEEFNPLWVEAPVWSVDIPAVVAVAQASTLRIGVGGHHTSLRAIADLLACGRIDIVLPEYVEFGGLHRLRQIAAIAEAYQAVLAPHNARCMLSTALNVHFDVATRNVLIQEAFDDFNEPWARSLFVGVPKVVDGYFEASDAPGLGVEVDEEEAARHPYSDRNFLHLFQDGWETRLGVNTDN